MGSSILNKTLETFRHGRDLDGGDAEPVLDALIAESDEMLLADVFHAWNDKGIAEDEIYSIAKILRERCTKVISRRERFIDIVGTGGSRSKTFNVSTAAAFVVAGAGVAVAKHGNRAATSNSGSADVLFVLGIAPAVDAATAERSLNDIGICFMFAPKFHRLSATLGKVRSRLGFPTIFNCVGPLCNPAGAPHQLIGVWSKEMIRKMAGALGRLGTQKSWVVHGEDGLDEISLSAMTSVAEVFDGQVREFEISASDFGVASESLDGLRVDSADESASIIRKVLEPSGDEFAARSLVQINAAAAIYVAGVGNDLKEAHRAAADSISGGHASGRLESFVALQRI
jgi:anthranilate phosphoribosyltransferase